MEEKKTNTVFHVYLKETDKHYYFGSIAAIFDVFTYNDIKVKQRRLYDVNVEEGKPYQNKVCIIRKGDIHRKPGNRQSPKVKNKC